MGILSAGAALGQITKDAISASRHVPGYVLNGLKKTREIVDRKDEIKDKLGQIAKDARLFSGQITNDAISASRHVPGYVLNGLKKTREIVDGKDEIKVKLGQIAKDARLFSGQIAKDARLFSGQITNDAISASRHVPGYVLNGLQKTREIVDGKDEIKVKLGKFAHGAISAARPLPGYVWSGIAAVPAMAGEMYEKYEFVNLLDQETKDKLGKFAYDWISAGIAAVTIEAREIYENSNEFINSLDDDTKEKLGKFAYDWISAGIVGVPIEAGEIYENANEFINSLDDDTKEKLVSVMKFTGGATLLVGGATLALPAFGFTVAGVKAASAAAYVHSMIGNVSAASTFALLQSAGVLGFGVKTKVALGIAGGVLFSAPTL